MLFKNEVLEGIRSGKITLAFRYWTKPTIRAGGSLRTPVGILAIKDIAPTHPDKISDDEARCAGFDTCNALLAGLQKRGGTLYRIAFHLAGPDPRTALRQIDRLDDAELTNLRERLAALDHGSRSGAWTAQVLHLIGEHDGRTAGEIAESLGIEKSTVKRKIRQLKELGLTESLQSGYRLSDRGRAVQKWLSRKS